MISLLIQEERKLWNDMMECIDKLGLHNPITDVSVARWSAVHQLTFKIVKK